MSRAEIDRLMRDFYAARGRGDLEAVLRSFCTDAAFQIASANQDSPVAIKANGVDEFRPLLALLIKTFRLGDLTIRSMAIEDAQATVHWRANVRSRITGATVPTEMIDIVEVRDGCIVNFNEVFVPRQGLT
jgi:ketosteroid isomerase-like protein